MARISIIPGFLFIFCIATISCSQTNPSLPFITRSYVGSTPCDSFIKAALTITDTQHLDFIKWELGFIVNKNDSSGFQLTALYGISQPNTNGFIGSGKKITVTGNYTIEYGTSTIAGIKTYRLTGNGLHSPIFLLEMDSNILHFADNNKNFLVGNGGWGFVLNRIK